MMVSGYFLNITENFVMITYDIQTLLFSLEFLEKCFTN